MRLCGSATGTTFSSMFNFTMAPFNFPSPSNTEECFARSLFSFPSSVTGDEGVVFVDILFKWSVARPNSCAVSPLMRLPDLLLLTM